MPIGGCSSGGASQRYIPPVACVHDMAMRASESTSDGTASASVPSCNPRGIFAAPPFGWHVSFCHFQSFCHATGQATTRRGPVLMFSMDWTIGPAALEPAKNLARIRACVRRSARLERRCIASTRSCSPSPRASSQERAHRTTETPSSSTTMATEH